jgi:non-specific protein-tyrosine kinase
MSLVTLFNILFVRQRRLLLTTFVAAVCAAGVVTFVLPDQYTSAATLFVGENRAGGSSGNAPQADEVLAQSYRQLLATAAIREEVARRLPFGVSSGQLAGKVRFDLATGTHLIYIRATDRRPQRAATIANTYARTFVANRRRTAEENSRTRLADISRSIERLTRRVRQLSGQKGSGPAFNSAVTQLNAARRSYQEISSDTALSGSNVNLSVPATVSATPSKPRRKLYLAVGVLFAASLAVGLAFVMDAFDKRIREDSELEEIFGAPVLAQVPTAGKGDDRALQEAFEFLRTNLHFVGGRDGSVRTVAVTSAVPGSGKTFVTSHLCETLAVANSTVVAVEGDLRKPKLPEAFGVAPEHGVSNVLADSGEPGACLETADSGVRVLASGPLPPNPALLFSSDRFSTMLASLRKESEHVVVDTPPVLAGPETSLIGSLVDGVVFVVDMKRPRRDVLIAARDQLAKGDARILGLVLNRTPRSSGGAGYYYGDEYEAD